MGKRITLGVCAAAAVAAAGLASSASAGTAEHTYAAMAFEKSSGVLGTVWLQDTRKDAKANAIAECKELADKPNKCKVVENVKDGCLAAALNAKTDAYGFGSGPTPRKAKKGAKNDSGGGRPYYVVCSDEGPV